MTATAPDSGETTLPSVPVTAVPLASVARRGPREGSLYWRGWVPEPGRLRVAVVGSRAATPEQWACAHALGRQLAAAGVVVCSGGALGIDAAALQGALDAGSGVAPLAVLPAAIDRPFPPANRPLFEAMVGAGGALCSQVTPGDAHTRGRFHNRNTLLVQLVDAVIAVCAERPSGTLHCAGQAWRQGIPVLAVPWPPGTPCSQGVTALLLAGARTVWPGAALETLLGQLATTPELLLQRADLPPPPRPEPATKPPSAQQTFDAIAPAWPCYAANPAPAAAGWHHPDGCDASVVARLRDSLSTAGATGMTVAELAAATGLTRTVVAETVLQWTLAGGLRRIAGSWYALESGV